MTEFVCGNIFIRKNQLRIAGDFTEGHTHNFDHMTLVWSGAVHVSATLPNGTMIERDFPAKTWFLVRKDVLHHISAIEDNTEYWCVYSHRTPKGEVIQEWDGWKEATL